MSNLQEINLPEPYHKDVIPIDVLIGYSNKGLSYSEIGKLVGCNKSNISQRFSKAGFIPEHLKSFKENRADVFAHMQRKFLLSINDEQIQNMAPRDKVLSAGILYDKERLERGQSTSITAFEGLPDDALHAKIGGLLERASRIGIRVADIVGDIPQDVRDRTGIDGQLSLPGDDK